MSAIDPNRPVIVGVAQRSVRETGSEPIELMVAVCEQALADTGGRGLRSRIGSVRVNKGIWPYADPGSIIGARLGLQDVPTTLNRVGGNEAYDLLSVTAAEIQAGELDAAVICAGETMRTRRRDRRAGVETSYLAERADAAPTVSFGVSEPMVTETEAAAGIAVPVNFYAMAETAIRHRCGELPAAHRERIAALWARAAEVATGNPHAWLREGYSAGDIAAAGPGNRMVAAPYSKLMTSNLDVDQGVALVICAASTAEECGVPLDRCVFPWVGTAAADQQSPGRRWALDESPAMRIAGRCALELAARRADEIDLLDLYSCFPSAVQVAQRELALECDRPFTVTGGLTFAGGPFNSYCLHALATAVTELRERGGSATALLSGNGGYFSKHSFAVLGAEPAARAYVYAKPQQEVDAHPIRPEPEPDATGGTLEAYTVAFSRDGEPERGIVGVLGASGARTWADTSDAHTIAALLTDDQVGRPVELRREATVPVVEFA